MRRETDSNRGVLWTFVLLAPLACGGDSTTPEPTGPDLPRAPAAVTLSADMLRFAALGVSGQLTATVTDAESVTIEDAELTWSTLDETIATVDATGLVQAVGVGKTEVVASAGEASGSATVLVTQDPASIAVDAALTELVAIGDSARLSATVTDANGHAIEGAAVEWTSGDASVATVSASGWVVAVDNGTVEVTAAAGEASGVAEVRVEQVLATLEVAPATVVLGEGETAELSATLLDARGHPLRGAALDGLTVAWTSADEGLVVVDDAGRLTAVRWGGETVLTATAGEVSGEAAVSVLDQIAFVALRDGFYGIYRMNADGSGEVELTVDSDVDPIAAAWSPDGSKIAFESLRDGNREIYVMNADGTGLTNLSMDPATDEQPTWSPDGSMIALVSERDGQTEIYAVAAAGSPPMRLTIHEGSDRNPAWGPGLIAYVRNGDLYAMDSFGHGQSPLTSLDNSVNWPVWSPDGTRLAFMYGSFLSQQIYLLEAAGGEPVPLSVFPGLAIGTAWSPDGTRVAYTQASDAVFYDIVVARADGTGTTNLTQDQAFGGFPSWSPDGGRIAFISASEATPDPELHVIGADGTGRVEIPVDGAPSNPMWRPRP